MSRVKSRADKARDKDKGGTVNKDNVSSGNLNNDIVLGKFTEGDWHSLLLDDEHEEFIVDVIEGVVQETLKICYQKYIDKQLFPYTILQAKQAMIEIIDWQFLSSDQGENENSFIRDWEEDEEAEPSVYDSWVIGAVPYNRMTSVTSRSEAIDEVMEEIDNEKDIGLDDQISDVSDIQETPSPENLDVYIPTTETDIIPENVIPKEKKKRKYIPHTGPLRSAGLKGIAKSMYETEKELEEEERNNYLKDEAQPNESHVPVALANALKSQVGRPPGLCEVPLEDLTNVVITNRVPTESLPSNHVQTRCTVVDPEVEAAQTRLQAMRTGRYMQPQGSIGTSKNKDSRAIKIEKQMNYEKVATSTVAPVPPPLIEAMEVVPGVTVREGGRVKQGPKRLQKHSSTGGPEESQMALLPISKNKSKQAINSNDIIGFSVPRIQPLPPIA